MALDPPERPTRIVPADKDSIAQGAKLLREGRLAGFPPHTVSGPGPNARAADATSAASAADELQGRVDQILDGGPCPLGIESTGIGFDGKNPIRLRPGAIPRGDIENLVGPLRDPDGAMVQAPGMMASHYAPRARLRLN